MAREVADTWSISVGLASLGRLAFREGRQPRARTCSGRRSSSPRSAAATGSRPSASPPWPMPPPVAPTTRRRVCSAPPRRCAAHRRDALADRDITSGQETLDRVREALGESDFATEWDAGLALSLDDAVAFALSRSAADADGADREAELGRLLDRVRDAIARYDAGDIDAFESTTSSSTTSGRRRSRASGQIQPPSASRQTDDHGDRRLRGRVHYATKRGIA